MIALEYRLGYRTAMKVSWDDDTTSLPDTVSNTFKGSKEILMNAFLKKTFMQKTIRKVESVNKKT